MEKKVRIPEPDRLKRIEEVREMLGWKNLVYDHTNRPDIKKLVFVGAFQNDVICPRNEDNHNIAVCQAMSLGRKPSFSDPLRWGEEDLRTYIACFNYVECREEHGECLVAKRIHELLPEARVSVEYTIAHIKSRAEGGYFHRQGKQAIVVGRDADKLILTENTRY